MSRSLIVLPDDSVQPILDAIDGAKKSLRIKMFIFTDASLLDAVIAAHRRGVNVRIMLNPKRRNGVSENDESRSKLEAAGIEVRAVPGASAVTAALSIAGLATDRFVFEGFLPVRAAERRALLARLAVEARTLVLFEAPHRIAATLADLARSFGDERPAVGTRELTKMHETVYRGTLRELCVMAREDHDFERGEITVVIAGAAPGKALGGDTELLTRALQLLLTELPPARAAAIAAQLAGARRSDAYQLALRLQHGPVAD